MSAISAKAGQVTRGRDNLKWFLRIGMLPLIVSSILVMPEFTPQNADAICSPGGICYGTSQRKGFDSCDAPSINEMSARWSDSPYWDIGIYIGGANRACSSQSNLDYNWVQTVNAQGWDFYLTWVGAQSRCAWGPPGPYRTDFITWIDSNTTNAFNQGKSEALTAMSAASNLGIYGSKIFYLDIESYNSGDTTCRNAAASFVNGWGYQLRGVSGHKAGVYGSPCNALDWIVQYVPDDVWLATGNGDPDVWGLVCLDNGYWYNAQRLHQYALNVYENYGGVGRWVDKDCAYGLVVPNGHYLNDPACTVE